MVKPPKLRKPPEMLTKLLSEDSTEARKFRLNIRSYNNLLSFASKGISGKLYDKGAVLYCIFYTILYCTDSIQLYCNSTRSSWPYEPFLLATAEVCGTFSPWVT